MEGNTVSVAVGIVGAVDGYSVGSMDGDSVGLAEGYLVGNPVGLSVGSVVGVLVHQQSLPGENGFVLVRPLPILSHAIVTMPIF